jgi:beta-lactamase regulating signal transducer with metallopeptidase domain
MTSIAALQLAPDFLAPLASAAVRALALAGVAGTGLMVLRVKSTSARLFTWTAVLYAGLAMPLLERMLPSLPVPAPAFFQTAGKQSAATVAEAAQPRNVFTGDVNSATPTRVTPLPNLPSHKGFAWSTVRWNDAATGVYFAMAFFLLTRFFVGLAFGRRLRRSSKAILEPRIAQSLASHARANGLSSIPHAAESAFISVPVTMGVMRSVIFLPATWRDWDDAKLNAVIAHEVSHVARRDTLTQRLSFLHCTIFWFSPLAWWLNRHLADLMEQASDEAALAGGADRKVYARTLLAFFEALQAAPGRVWWQGVSMAAAGRAERRAEARVEKILGWKGVVTMRLKKSMAVVVVALAVPVVYLTASARPAVRNADSQTSNSILIAQNQVAPTPAVAPHAARAPKKASTHSFYSYSDDDAASFVIASGKEDSFTISGMRDNGEIEALRKKISGDFIWFRHDGKSYVIRDQATIDRAKAFWAPQSELGKKQEELGKQQEALGKQQEALSERMERVRVKVPDMTKELDQLHATLKKFNSDATMEQIGQIQSEIGELQSKIGDLQSQAGDQQGKLGDEMGALGEKQGKLGEQQGELGRKQGELAEQATRQMKRLLDESIVKGTAQLEQ